MAGIDGGGEAIRVVQPEDVSLGDRDIMDAIMMASAMSPGRNGLPRREDLFADRTNLPRPVKVFTDQGRLCLLVTRATIDVVRGQAIIAGQEDPSQ